MVNKEQVINDANEVIKALTDTTLIDNAINETESELEVISELVRKLVRENASHSQNQNDYTKKYKELFFIGYLAFDTVCHIRVDRNRDNPLDYLPDPSRFYDTSNGKVDYKIVRRLKYLSCSELDIDFEEAFRLEPSLEYEVNAIFEDSDEPNGSNMA